MKYKGHLISMIDYHNASPPYITFKVINKDNHELETVFLIEFHDKERLKIGRANDADFRLRDITISRFHSILVYNKGCIYIEDMRSKFGTLVLIQNTIMFLPEKPISFQKGKYHLMFNLKPKWCTKFCCGRNKGLKALGYNDVISCQNLHIYHNELKQIKVLLGDSSLLSSSVSEIDESSQIKNELKIVTEQTNEHLTTCNNKNDQSNRNISKTYLHHNSSLVNFIKVVSKNENKEENDKNNNDNSIKAKIKNNNCSFESGKYLVMNNNNQRQVSQNNLLQSDILDDNQSYHLPKNKINLLSKINVISINNGKSDDIKYSLSCKVNYLQHSTKTKK